MDLQTCSNCGREFDFDKEGLGSDHGGYVCSPECAKGLAAKRGLHYAIHDETDAIVDSDVTKPAKPTKPKKKRDSSINRALHYASLRRGQGWKWPQLPWKTRWCIKWWTFWDLKPWGWVSFRLMQKRIRRLEQQLDFNQETSDAGSHV